MTDWNGQPPWANLYPAIGTPVIIIPALWLLLAAFPVIAGVRCFRSDHPVAADDRKLFVASTFILLCVAFCVYLKLSELVKVWYFIPPMALGAMCLEAGLAVTRPRLRALRLAVVVSLVAATFLSSLRSARGGRRRNRPAHRFVRPAPRRSERLVGGVSHSYLGLAGSLFWCRLLQADRSWKSRQSPSMSPGDGGNLTNDGLEFRAGVPHCR